MGHGVILKGSVPTRTRSFRRSRGEAMSSRRGKGEGSIKKRADGRWEARLELGWRDGKRRRKYICAKTRQEVQQRLSKARRQLEEQGTLGDERQTVEAFLNRWLAHMEPRGMEPRVRPRN